MPKTYWVQVEGVISDAAIDELQRGVTLKDGRTKPAMAKRITEPLPKRDPDIRTRASVDTSWIELIIVEGRNRQVRRMTAAVDYPTLRLFRACVGPWQIGSLAPGEMKFEQVNLPVS